MSNQDDTTQQAGQTPAPVEVPPVAPSSNLTEEVELEVPAAEVAPEPEVRSEPEAPVDVAEAAPQPSTEELVGGYKRLQRATTVKLDGKTLPTVGFGHLVKSPLTPGHDKNTRPVLVLPAASMAEFASQGALLRQTPIVGDSQAEAWLEDLDRGLAHLPARDGLVEALADNTAKWEQAPEINGKKIHMLRGKPPAHENQVLTSNNALEYALGALRIGMPIVTPLWSSGWSVTFRPATEDEWVAFNERLSYLKAQVGRNLHGLTMSNINAAYKEAALDFAHQHIAETNIQFDTTANAGNYNYISILASTDVDTFLMGFLAACYPSGYPISRGCMADIGKCFHRVEETINLALLLVTNTVRLEERHRNQMARNGRGSVTISEVLEYQKTLPASQEQQVVLVEPNEELGIVGVTATLHVPTAEQLILAGKRWQLSIEEMVKNVLGQEATTRQREESYFNFSKASMLREYSHFVKHLTIGTNNIEGVESVEKVLTNVTSHKTLVDSLYEQVRKYVERSVVGVVALPNYTCPSCNKAQKPVDEGNPLTKILPLDVTSAFFALAHLRLVEILER